MWTEVVDGSCGRKLWTKVVDGSCGRKLWTVDGSDFRSSLLDRDRLMELSLRAGSHFRWCNRVAQAAKRSARPLAGSLRSPTRNSRLRRSCHTITTTKMRACSQAIWSSK